MQLLRLLAAASVAIAAVILRDDGTTGGGLMVPHAGPVSQESSSVWEANIVVVADYDQIWQNAPGQGIAAAESAAIPVEVAETSASVQAVTKIRLKKGGPRRGKYYYVTVPQTNQQICVRFIRLVGEEVWSIDQDPPLAETNHKHVECVFYADRECSGSRGELRLRDRVFIPDLSKVKRKDGNWYNQIGTIRCTWKSAATANDNGSINGTAGDASLSQLKTTRDKDSGISDEPAPANNIASVDAEATQGANDDHTVELWTEKNFKGSKYWAYERHAEKSTCLNVPLKGKATIQSVKQYKGTKSIPMKCTYFGERNCVLELWHIHKPTDMPDTTQPPRNRGYTIRSFRCISPPSHSGVDGEESTL